MHTAGGPRLVSIQSRSDGTYVAVEIGSASPDHKEARITAESAEDALNQIVAHLDGAAFIPLPQDWRTNRRPRY